MTATKQRRGVTIESLDRRLRTAERKLRGIAGGSAAGLTLGDVFRSFPGEVAGLAEAMGVNTDTLYDFEKGRNKRVRFPVKVATSIVRAFRRRRVQAVAGEVKLSVAWLRQAWKSVPFEE